MTESFCSLLSFLTSCELFFFIIIAITKSEPPFNIRRAPVKIVSISPASLVPARIVITPPNMVTTIPNIKSNTNFTKVQIVNTTNYLNMIPT